MIKRPPKILVIKSDKSELKKVESFLKDIFKEYNVNQINFNKIYLCVSEAVINSIKHGNKKDNSKNVTIEAAFSENEIIVHVEDEGEGFDMEKINEPTSKENIRSESGRGIFIIKNLSKNMEYNEKGNRIQFKIECL